MLFIDVTANYCEHFTKHINTMCCKIQFFKNVGNAYNSNHCALKG